METLPLYPKLDSSIAYENITDKINKNLSDARIKEIQAKRHELEQNLKHYKKIIKRWKQFSNFLNYASLIILTGVGTSFMVLGFGAFTIPVVFGILAAIGTGEGIIHGGLTLGLVKKKKETFKKKIEHTQEYISKSWYLFEKIREDNIITLDEVNEFRKLMDQYEKGLSIEDDSMDKEFLKLRESLKHQAEKEVKKEIKIDLKNDLKNELKQKYSHK